MTDRMTSFASAVARRRPEVAATLLSMLLAAALLAGPADARTARSSSSVAPFAALLATSPAVQTTGASSETQTSATLNGVVNPDGAEVTACTFEYGTSPSYGSSVPCSSLPGAGESPVAVSAAVEGLTPNTTYHFRIVATNEKGTSEGSDGSFTTLPNPPTVETSAASSISSTSATLNATVNPNGDEVSNCHFDYGTSPSYGKSVPCASSPGAGESPVTVSASPAGLGPGSTYHFRIVAANAGGTSPGGDQAFTTPAAAPTVVTKAASSVTQTTATLNATVNPNGGNVTDCHFDYGVLTTSEFSAACSSLPGSGNTPIGVSASVASLTASTTYMVRIVATNEGGTTTDPSSQTFTTLPDAPTVVTGAATSVTKTSATLNATVNPNGGFVSQCKLEYGPDESYGFSASCSPSPGSGESPVGVSAAVGGLSANTTYHFRIVAANAGGKNFGADQVFETAANSPTVVTGGASAVTQSTATLNATVNPNGVNVSDCKLEYGPSASYGASAPCSPPPGSGGSAVAVSAAVGGLSPNTTYHFRIVATNAGGQSEGGDRSFTTFPEAPTVVTGTASAISQSTATLHATVNPNGGSVSTCRFDYGTSAAYGFSASCSSLPGSGKNPVGVSTAVGSLSANTTYHFRIVATNSGGISEGADQTLMTLPEGPGVETGTASSITQTTATLNATVNPNGANVSGCELEYGTSTSYGSSAPCSSLPGSGASPVAVSATVEALKANTTYHFRIVAANAGGTSEGSDRTFRTLPNAPAVVTKAASSITQTSATLNATVNSNGGEMSDCHFEYGTSEAYGSSVPCSALSGSVSATVGALTANTIYHFRVVATNQGGTGFGGDEAFLTSPGPPTVETTPATSVTPTSAVVNATVNPNGGTVTNCHFDYGTTKAYGSSKPCSSLPGSGTTPVAVSAPLTGLSPNTTYFFRIVAISPGGASTDIIGQTFTTLPNPPTVLTTAAKLITQTTATLNATVNPNSGTVSDCHFEYGPSKAYGSIAPCNSLPGSGNKPVEVLASATGLEANTTYHFRIVAANLGGASEGSDQTFKTLPNAPTILAESATFPPTPTTATVNATVNPNGGLVTNCHFEYGTTLSYGSSALCSAPAGSGIEPVAVSAPLAGLTKNTTYHFRILATNAGGTGLGSDQTFLTAPGPPTVEVREPSSIGQTSAIASATVNPHGGVIKPSSCFFNYGTTESLGSKTPCEPFTELGGAPIEVSALLEGLSADTPYFFSIEVENTFGEKYPRAGVKPEVEEFKTLPGPSVVTGAASEFTQTSATLNAIVNPNGGEVSDCHFEYGTSPSYGSSVPCTSLPGKGTSRVEVSAPLTGLSPNTTYYFVIVAKNGAGTSVNTRGRTFRTLPYPPIVATGSASAVTQSSATLNGTVNPNGASVSGCQFEYGPSASYGSSVACASLPGPGTSAVAVSASPGGLSANTTYHFRIVASNAGATSAGADAAFTTSPPTATSGPSAPPAVAAASGTVSLVSANIATQSSGRAAVRLSCSGSTQTCAGKLTLAVRIRSKRAGRSSLSVVLGTAGFSIAAGRTSVVKLKLNRIGRSLLNARHGRMIASLTIFTAFPGPPQTLTQPVHLTLAKVNRLKKRK